MKFPRSQKKKTDKEKIPPPLYERALALAARALRSTNELRQKLLSEGYDSEGVEAALLRLKEVYLLDDARVAAAVGRQYKEKGDRFILNKLKSRGIDTEENAAVFEALSDELTRALDVGQKKLKVLAAFEARVQSQKLYRYLASRGFAANTVEKAVRRLIPD